MEFSGIHPADAQLAIELQLADIKAILEEPERGDEYAAFEYLMAGLQETLSLFQDQVFALSLLRADHSARVVLDNLIQEERQAEEDHELACEISGIVADQPNRPDSVPGDNLGGQNRWLIDDVDTIYPAVAEIAKGDHVAADMICLESSISTRYAGDDVGFEGRTTDSSTCSTGSGSKGKGSNTESSSEEEHMTHTPCSACMEQCARFDALELSCKRPEDTSYHAYCRDCLTDLFRTSLTDTTLFPPKCCGTRIPISACLDICPPALMQQFREKELELAAPNPVYCSNRYCAKFIKAEHIVAELATCQSCNSETCTVCKNPKHNGLCPQDRTFQSLLEMAGRKKWNRCPRCRTMVELITGCYHMRCRCSAEFCYLCAKLWKTCSCSQSDENRLLSNDGETDGPGTIIAMPEEEEVLEADPSLDVLSDLELRIATVAGGFAITNDEGEAEGNAEHLLDVCHHRWGRLYGSQGELEVCGICFHRLKFVNVCATCRTKVCTRCLHNRL